MTVAEVFTWPKQKMLLTKSNLKTNKNFVVWNVGTISLQLAPAQESVRWNLCPFAGACADLCLRTCGHNKLHMAKNIRVLRTEFLHLDFPGFKDRLFQELDAFAKWCKNKNARMGVRLNCLSDVVWETKLPEVFKRYPDAIFYDYTKIPVRYQRWLKGLLPSNYHLTYSLSGENPSSHKSAKRFLELGGTVAIVFDELPDDMQWEGWVVWPGDDSDARWRDPPGSVVGLLAKGPAKKDTAGFVVRPNG